MIGVKLATAQANFFDRALVLSAVDKATQRNLSKAGAFIRRTAKGLIRSGKKHSKPGNPPKSHTGLLRNLILFSYDPTRRSVVVGPAKTNQVFFQGEGRPVTGTVPAVLEYGGQVGILEVFKRGQWRRADLRSRRRNAGLPTRIRTVTIAPRPYMQPALLKEKVKFSRIWADTITGAAA